MRQFDRQDVAGGLFGVDGNVVLPKFTTVSQYRDEKGNERDALGIGSETWVTELKWKKSAAGEREMNKLIASAHRLAADKAWFVSQNGFTAEAVELAAQNGVLVTDGDGFAEIRRLVWK